MNVRAKGIGGLICLAILGAPAFAAEQSKVPGSDTTRPGVEAPRPPAAPPADLVPVSVVVSPAVPWAGDAVGPITVTVANQGGLPIGQSKVVLSWFGPVCAPLTCAQCQGFKLRGYDPNLYSAVEWSVPALAAGQPMSFTLALAQPKTWPAGKTGFFLFVNVDKLAKGESDNDNNGKSFEITANKHKKSEVPGSGPVRKVPMRQLKK